MMLPDVCTESPRQATLIVFDGRALNQAAARSLYKSFGPAPAGTLETRRLSRPRHF